MADELEQMALTYHRWPVAGKLEIVPTKKLANQRDLSLAYSPGVAAACRAIADDPGQATDMTIRGNLVAVLSNGTAVLGLGDIGPLAAKPVMEGKAVLFKKFAGIDVFDLEVDEHDPAKLVDIIAALEPTFGGINLEDIKAPECFEIEAQCRARMNIPVFHDDQHGTAICVAAAIYNGLRLVDKPIETVRLVCAGAGAAALACLDLVVSMGLKKENILIADIDGIVYSGRSHGMDPYKARYAQPTEARTLADALPGADVFLGLSAGGILSAEDVATMADQPLILALANPTPEIDPDTARLGKPDAVIATGRSDFPNQVNNVLCFPFLFRGALDVGAREINEAMKIAAVKAIADLAMAEASDVVASAYGAEELSFGPDYIIPKPFDPRLILSVAPAVARAAMDSGVATRPIADFDAYLQRLTQHIYRTGFAMKPIFDNAKQAPKRVVYSDGEEELVLQAAQIVVDDQLARPILLGRHHIITQKIKQLGLRLKAGETITIIDPASDAQAHQYASRYHDLMARRGVAPDSADVQVRTRTSLYASLMVEAGDADTMICGVVGLFSKHLERLLNVIGLQDGVDDASALQLLILNQASVFICDTAVTYDPDEEQIVQMAELGAEQVRRFGMEPKIALVSHSDFGSSNAPSALKMRRARARIKARQPNLQVEGEMRADSALADYIRGRIFPKAELEGAANLLVMPNLDAANIAFNMARILGDGIAVGPMLIGMRKPVHIVTPSITVRGLVNMTAVAVVDAQHSAQTTAQAAE